MMEYRPPFYTGRRRAPRRRPTTPPLAPAPTIAFTPVWICPIHGLTRCPCRPGSPR